MSQRFVDRRRFLLNTALVSAAGVLAEGVRHPAAAFSVYPMSPELKASYLAAKSCGTDQSTHDRITRTVLAKLNAMPAPPPGQSLSETVICPICGCPIVVSRTGS
ncbi:MAG TPA: hypothetical protein VMU42_01680 [Candidatus Sulfotelmatobacter sp.]|nr:hypothetical protein [Candidatus Sulfotelmatobacter sp.]